MKSIKDVLENIIKHNLFNDDYVIEPCNDEDIERVRIGQNIKRLPQFYIDFAKLMGNGAGLLFKSSTATCRSLIDIKPEIIKRLGDTFDENGFVLPDDAFVYQDGWEFFAYFCTDTDEENPTAYRYNIHLSDNPQKIGTFLDHLIEKYEETIRIVEMHKQQDEKTREIWRRTAQRRKDKEDK